MAAAPGRLVLVGTVHRDPAGEERLAALLDTLGPDLLTLEMSPAAARYRRTRGLLLAARLERILSRLSGEQERPREELSTHPAARDIRTLLALPYEYRAAAAHAERARIPLELIDLDEISLRKLRRVEEELVTYRNLRTLLRLPPTPAPGAEDYRLARTLLRPEALARLREDFLARRRGDEGIGHRDADMAATLRRLCAACPQACLVHIGGWVHLVDDPLGETLYSRLRDLAPERLLAG